MISKVGIKNFKCLRDVQIDLERFTIFVGPNASGKSSILQALEYLCRIFHNEEFENVLFQFVTRGAKDNIVFAVECGGKGYRYRTRSQKGPIVLGVSQPWSGEGRGFATNFNMHDVGWNRWPPNPHQASPSPLPASVLLRLETSKLITENAASPDPTVMAPDGIGLHFALANMALNDPDSWQELQDNLRQIIPSIRRLRHRKAAVGQPVAHALLFDTVGGDSLTASQVSEGTLLVLGLLAALQAPGRPSLVLLDDLDRGLHPKAQKELISLLRRLLDKNPELQIMAATHSPYMLDCMEANEVRMTYLGDDGGTLCAPLASHPKFAKWKDEMAPGEMWSLFGEKWLAEQGAPA